MPLNIIKKIFTKNSKRKKPNKSWLHLSKMEQTTFIKKRKCLTFNNIDFNKLKFLWKNNLYYYFWWIAIIFIILLYIIFWPIFRIQYIEIIKQDNITNMTIAYKATDKYRWKSIFTTKEIDILNRLKDYQQNIKDINTSIKLPSTLKINISSYKWVFNTMVNWKSFIITENWTLIPSSYSDNLKELKVVKEFDKNKFIDYKKILNSYFIKNISYIVEKVKENIIDINIKELKYYMTERELHIITDKNTTLIFNLNSLINEQIEKLSILNKEKFNINKSTIVYIDLRIKNKVFYCTTEKEYQCIQNIKNVYLNK